MRSGGSERRGAAGGGAPLGDARDEKLRNASEQLLVVERLTQQLRRLEQQRESRAGRLGFLLDLRPLDDRCQVVGDRSRKQDLALAPAVRLVAIEHESPELPPAQDERDERERRD